MNNRMIETAAVLGLIIALVVGAIMVAYLPQRRELECLQSEIAEQKLRIQSVSADVEVVPSMVEHVSAMKALYKDFDRKLPKSSELYGFLGKIGRHLEEGELSSQGIKPGRPIREELFHTLPIIMRCEGRYSELTKFLAEIDKMERLTRVQKLLISAGPKGDDLRIEVHMNIYFTER